MVDLTKPLTWDNFAQAKGHANHHVCVTCLGPIVVVQSDPFGASTDYHVKCLTCDKLLTDTTSSTVAQQVKTERRVGLVDLKRAMNKGKRKPPDEIIRDLGY